MYIKLLPYFKMSYNTSMTQQIIPTYITKYFWGDNIGELDLQKNKQYIIQTILDKGDQEAIKWLFASIEKKSIKEHLPALQLSKKSKHFWQIYLS